MCCLLILMNLWLVLSGMNHRKVGIQYILHQYEFRMSSTVPKWLFYFLILTELTSFLLSFVLWSFQVLGKDSMYYRIRSGKSLILGIPKAPQGNIQGQPRAKARGCPGWHPLFRLQSIVMLLCLELYFYSSHDMSFTWSVLCYSFIFVCFLVCHNHYLLDKPFHRDTHLPWFVRILYVPHLYLLS